MLPDFPLVKAAARSAFLNAVRRRVEHVEPILAGISHRRVHEGRNAKLTRADESVDNIEFQKAQAELVIPKEQMRRISIEQIAEHVNALAEQLAGQQVRLMFSRINEAVESVGNTVSAEDIGNKAAYLEMQRKVEVDFDPDTLNPRELTIAVHPGQAAKFIAELRQWNGDPDFIAEMERIRANQLEGWRAREDRRRLVD